MEWLDRHEPLFRAIEALGIWVTAAVTAAVGLFLYWRQRRDLTDAAMQANRSRVTEGYLRWHAMVLSTDENTRLSGEMLRWAHQIFAPGQDAVSPEDARRMHMLYFALNALYLEWTFREAYRLDKSDFLASVSNTLGGLFSNPRPHYRLIAEKLPELMKDFDRRFIEEVMAHLRKTG